MEKSFLKNGKSYLKSFSWCQSFHKIKVGTYQSILGRQSSYHFNTELQLNVS